MQIKFTSVSGKIFWANSILHAIGWVATNKTMPIFFIEVGISGFIFELLLIFRLAISGKLLRF
jgi:hypothetical protein